MQIIKTILKFTRKVAFIANYSYFLLSTLCNAISYIIFLVNCFYIFFATSFSLKDCFPIFLIFLIKKYKMFVSRFIQSEQTSCMVFLNQFKIKLLVILFHRKHINYFKNMIIFKGDCFRNKKQTFYMVFKKKEYLLQGNTVTKSTLIRLHQAKSIKHIVMM